MRGWLSWCWLLVLWSPLGAQVSPVLIQNPSFIGTPGAAHVPPGWQYCGAAHTSPTDLHPADLTLRRGYFQVELPAPDGKTYVGMVARPDGTTEGIGQKLGQPLLAGQCYRLQFQVARSPRYLSAIKDGTQMLNYTRPIRLEVWGSRGGICQQETLLAASEPVVSADWEGYTLTLQPEYDCNYISLRAAHLRSDAPVAGHLLIDALRPLVPVDCEDGEPIAMLSLDTLRPIVGHPDTLLSLIHRQGLQVAFAVDDFLPLHCFIDDTGRLRQNNRYIWAIAQAVQRLRGYRLEVIVLSEDDWSGEFRCAQLDYCLQRAGLAAGQYQVRRAGWRVGRKGWLWPPEGRELGMKIHKITK